MIFSSFFIAFNCYYLNRGPDFFFSFGGAISCSGASCGLILSPTVSLWRIMFKFSKSFSNFCLHSISREWAIFDIWLVLLLTSGPDKRSFST